MEQIEISQDSQRFQRQGSALVDKDGMIIQPKPKQCRRLYIFALIGIVLVVVWSIHYRNSIYNVADSPFEQEVQEYKQKQMIQISHDKQCYTQGLSFINRTHLLESCGIYRDSYFHILKYEQINGSTVITNEVYKSKKFNKEYFLQGSVHFPKNNMLYLLTWRQNTVFRYNMATMEEEHHLKWGSQGWGLTHNNSHLIVSDGSDTLFITNQKMEIVEKIKVKDHMGNPKSKLNELEWISEGQQQFVLVNVYTTSEIVKINLKTGQIVKYFLFEELAKKEAKAGHLQVFNGIAYHKESKTYLLTGKKWGSMYQTIHL